MEKIPTIDRTLHDLASPVTNVGIEAATVQDVYGHLGAPTAADGTVIPLDAKVLVMTEDEFSHLDQNVQEELLGAGYGPSGWLNTNAIWGVLAAMSGQPGKTMEAGYYIVSWDVGDKTMYAPLSAVLSPEQLSAYVAGAAAQLAQTTAGGTAVTGSQPTPQDYIDTNQEHHPRMLKLSDDNARVQYDVVPASAVPIEFSNDMLVDGWHTEMLPDHAAPVSPFGISADERGVPLKLFWVRHHVAE